MSTTLLLWTVCPFCHILISTLNDPTALLDIFILLDYIEAKIMNNNRLRAPNKNVQYNKGSKD